MLRRCDCSRKAAGAVGVLAALFLPSALLAQVRPLQYNGDELVKMAVQGEIAPPCSAIRPTG